MPERLAPAEKLPLAARKDLRDNWESKKAEREQQLTDLFGGEPWTIDINPLALWPYANEGDWARNSPGDMIANYVDAAIDSIKSWVNRNGDAEKQELYEACTARVLTMDFDEQGLFPYCGCKIDQEGRLTILFAENNLGTNLNDALGEDKLDKAVSGAPTLSSRPMSFIARRGVRADFEAEVGQVKSTIKELLGEDVELVPNFEANFDQIKGAPQGDVHSEWERNLGGFTLSYFKAFADYLRSNQFGSDDMLKEGILEAMEKKQVQFRVVDEISKLYNETVIEDGVVYLQCPPQRFGTNIDSISEGLIDAL